MHRSVRPDLAIMAAAAALTALPACGGRLASSADDASTPDAALCAPGAATCALPGVAASSDACLACASAAICQCHSVPNSTPWQPPADCDFDDAGCVNSKDTPLISQHACQVGAVEMVKCLASNPHRTCSTLYFDAHPGTIEPLGMEIALFRCTVCSTCADACAGTPNQDLCQ